MKAQAVRKDTDEALNPNPQYVWNWINCATPA